MRMLLTAFLLLLCCGAKAQTNEQEAFGLLRNALQQFFSAKELSFGYAVTAHCTDAQHQPQVTSYKGSYHRRDSSFVFQYAHTTTVSADGYLLNISSEDKTIIIQRNHQLQDPAIIFAQLDEEKYMVKGQVEMLKDSSRRITFIPRAGHGLDYVQSSVLILSPGGVIQQVIIHYDTRLQGDFDDKCGRLEISYSPATFSVPEARKLALAYYVTLKGDQVIPSGNFKGYQVISSLSYEEPHE